MKLRILTTAVCVAVLGLIALVSPMRRVIAQTSSSSAGDNVEPPTTQVIQGARGLCTPGSQGTCIFTLNWPTSFASSTYTVNCFNLGGGHLIVETRAAASVTLGFTESPGQGSLEDDCIGVYP
jgi:hypothetical protein